MKKLLLLMTLLGLTGCFSNHPLKKNDCYTIPSGGNTIMVKIVDISDIDVLVVEFDTERLRVVPLEYLKSNGQRYTCSFIERLAKPTFTIGG